MARINPNVYAPAEMSVWRPTTADDAEFSLTLDHPMKNMLGENVGTLYVRRPTVEDAEVYLNLQTQENPTPVTNAIVLMARLTGYSVDAIRDAKNGMDYAECVQCAMEIAAHFFGETAKARTNASNHDPT